MLSVGVCVFCNKALGDFGREVYVKLEGKHRAIGYCCRDCFAKIERRLTGTNAPAQQCGYSGTFIERSHLWLRDVS